MLLDRFHDPLGRFVYRMNPGATPAEVEAVCRRVFVRAAEEIRDTDDGVSLKIWLFRLAAEEARRLTADRPSAEDPESSGPPGDRDLAAAGGPDEWRLLLDRLGGPCRELAEFWYFSELDEPGIADAMEVGVDVLPRRLAMCLHRLETLKVPTVPGGADAPLRSA